MITRFTSFLESVKPEGWTRRTMPYSKSDFMQAINHLPYDFRSTPAAMWRGMPNTKAPYVYVTGSDGRVSAHTENYYTLWIDNRPAWDGYPKRSRSTICSTSAVRAQAYARKDGHVYGILPLKNDRHIAVCEKYDIWEEFEMKVGDIPEPVRDTFAHYMYEIPFEGDRSIDVSRFYDEYFTAPDANRALKEMGVSSASYQSMMTDIDRIYNGERAKAIVHMLDKLINTDSVRMYTYEEVAELQKDTSSYEGGRELWFEGDSVGMSTFEMDELTEVPEGTPMGRFNWAETPMEAFL